MQQVRIAQASCQTLPRADVEVIAQQSPVRLFCLALNAPQVGAKIEAPSAFNLWAGGAFSYDLVLPLLHS